MTKRIYIKDWLELKPYDRQSATDIYYLKICNEIKSAMTANRLAIEMQIYLSEKEVNLLACFLTSYFEDLISETNIWNSFIKAHKRLYGKKLPFYHLDEYYDEEVNNQDISFLIWYFFNSVQIENFNALFNKFIIKISEAVYEVLDKAWDFAPANKYLQSFYHIDKDEANYYVARTLIDTILFRTYLFYPDTLMRLQAQESKLIEENHDDRNMLAYLNENRDTMSHTMYTRLLGFTGKEWVAEILGENHPLNKAFLTLSEKIVGYFLYIGQDDEDIFIEHIASGKRFELTKKSFDQYKKLKERDTILFIGIVQWKNKWWFSGVYFKQSFDPDLILDEKNSSESRMAVNFLDFGRERLEDSLNQQFNAFKRFNNGSQIAFLPSTKIDYFLRQYSEYLKNHVRLSDKRQMLEDQHVKRDGFSGKELETPDFANFADSGLVFFNPKNGVEIVLGVNNAFPMSNNPFYNEEDSKEAIITLFMTDEMTGQLAMFCIDQCAKFLPFFNESIGKEYLKDIDFLLRFWKRGSYFSRPTTTFIS